MSGITQINADLPPYMTLALNRLFGPEAEAAFQPKSDHHWIFSRIRSMFISQFANSLKIEAITTLSDIGKGYDREVKITLAQMVKAGLLRRRIINKVSHWEVNY